MKTIALIIRAFLMSIPASVFAGALMLSVSLVCCLLH
jgi:hypothetical protein